MAREGPETAAPTTRPVPARPLRVLVGVGPPAWPDTPAALSADVRLVKAALLYGDAVALCSPAAALVDRLLRLEAAAPDTAGKLAALEALAADLGLGDGPRHLAAAYATVAGRRHPGDASRRAWIEAVADEQWEEARAALRAALDQGGHAELIDAVASGRLSVDPLGLGTVAAPADYAPVAADTYAGRVLDAVAGGLSVPMLDEATLDLLRQRGAGVSEPRAGWARQGGLVADWLPRLPLFDLATVAETLEIRRDLEAYLDRFRAAVLAFGEAVAAAVWDADFPVEAERLFRRDVAPAICDIEDAVATVGFLRELTARYADAPGRFLPLAAPALTVGLAAPGWVLDAVGTALAASSAGANAVRAWRDARDRRREVEAHGLFFYHALGERLRGRV